MFRVFPPTFKPFLQKIRLLQVAKILTSDQNKLSGNHGVIFTPFAAKQVCLWPVKRVTCTYFVAITRKYSLLYVTTLRTLQQPDFSYKMGLNVGGKTHNSACSTRFAAMFQTKLHLFVPVLKELKSVVSCKLINGYFTSNESVTTGCKQRRDADTNSHLFNS